MSEVETNPELLETDRTHTVSIDSVGTLGRFSVGGGPGYTYSSTIEILIEGQGGATATYRVEFGVSDADNPRQIHWFEMPDEFTYPTTSFVDQSWQQSRRYIRIIVDSAAPANSEAKVSVCYGR